MTTDGIRRKLTAILSADVKGYSRLMREDEVATVQTLTNYREAMTMLINQHHGRVVDSPGDNLLAEFASVVDAVQGAVAIQKELKVRNGELPDDRRMEFRIGINLGDVIVEEDRIYGDGVNIAARLEGLAAPGGICVSRTAFDQIEDKLPLGYEYMGERAVKNINKPVRAYKVLLETEEVPAPIILDEGPDHGARKRALKAEEKAKRRRHKKRDKDSGIQSEKSVEKGKVKRKNSFVLHLRAYIGVICFLLIINGLTYSGTIWIHWPALGWGLGLYLHWFHRKRGDKTNVKMRSISGLHRHAGTYVGVIGFLLIINIVTYGGTVWIHWPALGWGLLLFFHWLVFSPTSKEKASKNSQDL